MESSDLFSGLLKSLLEKLQPATPQQPQDSGEDEKLKKLIREVLEEKSQTTAQNDLLHRVVGLMEQQEANKNREKYQQDVAKATETFKALMKVTEVDKTFKGGETSTSDRKNVFKDMLDKKSCNTDSAAANQNINVTKNRLAPGPFDDDGDLKKPTASRPRVEAKVMNNGAGAKPARGQSRGGRGGNRGTSGPSYNAAPPPPLLNSPLAPPIPGNHNAAPGYYRGGRGNYMEHRGRGHYTKQSPGNQYQGPGNQYQGAGNQYHNPGNQYHDPGNRYQGPVNQYQGPENQYQFPRNPYQGSDDFQGHGNRQNRGRGNHPYRGQGYHQNHGQESYGYKGTGNYQNQEEGGFYDYGGSNYQDNSNSSQSYQPRGHHHRGRGSYENSGDGIQHRQHLGMPVGDPEDRGRSRDQHRGGGNAHHRSYSEHRNKVADNHTAPFPPPPGHQGPGILGPYRGRGAFPKRAPNSAQTKVYQQETVKNNANMLDNDIDSDASTASAILPGVVKKKANKNKKKNTKKAPNTENAATVPANDDDSSVHVDDPVTATVNEVRSDKNVKGKATPLQLFLGSGFNEEVAKTMDSGSAITDIMLIAKVGGEIITNTPKTLGELRFFKKKHPLTEVIVVRSNED